MKGSLACIIHDLIMLEICKISEKKKLLSMANLDLGLDLDILPHSSNQHLVLFQVTPRHLHFDRSSSGIDKCAQRTSLGVSDSSKC